MTTQSLKIGFIGLGIMGAPMAGHLITAGHQLFVHTRGKVPAGIASSTATQCLISRGAAERADIIFLMMPDTPDVQAVLLAKKISAIGCNYLNAPVSGGGACTGEAGQFRNRAKGRLSTRRSRG